jgi:glycosyltransferase involved in cell wall biosynthesis
MTTYNCGEYILQAIKSILNQTYKDFELLIIDDGSTDNTKNIVNGIRDKRIRFISSEHIGRSSALNLGLQEAKYDIISFCDADDIIHPQKIEKQIGLFRNYNDLVFTDTAFFKNKKILYELKIENDLEIIKRKIALHGHFGPSVLFNKKFIIDNGGYDDSLTAFIDYELLLRIFNKSRIIHIPEILYFQRLRKNSISTTETMKKKHLVYEIQKPYFDKLKEITGITTIEEQLLIKGWREFFYGEKKSSRKYWKDAGLKSWDLKLFITFFLSYFPDSFLNHLKDGRIRLRFEYFIKKLFTGYNIQNRFKEILIQLSEN